MRFTVFFLLTIFLSHSVYADLILGLNIGRDASNRAELEYNSLGNGQERMNLNGSNSATALRLGYQGQNFFYVNQLSMRSYEYSSSTPSEFKTHSMVDAQLEFQLGYKWRAWKELYPYVSAGIGLGYSEISYVSGLPSSNEDYQGFLVSGFLNQGVEWRVKDWLGLQFEIRSLDYSIASYSDNSSNLNEDLFKSHSRFGWNLGVNFYL